MSPVVPPPRGRCRAASALAALLLPLALSAQPAATAPAAASAPSAAMAASASGPAALLAEDPQLELRVQRLSEQLRCLVCQNQTIADSHAGLAIDLKNQVREQLRAGRSDQQVIDFMVERFGDFVLYKPPLRASTLLLWAGPFALLLLGGGLLLRRLRQADPATPLDAEAKARAAALLAAEERP